MKNLILSFTLFVGLISVGNFAFANDCRQLAGRIQTSCTQNPSYEAAMQNRGLWQQITRTSESGESADDPGLGATTTGAIAEGKAEQASLEDVLTQCREAKDECVKTCQSEIDAHNTNASNLVKAKQDPSPEEKLAKDAKERGDSCVKEYSATEAKKQSMSANIGQALQALAAIAQMLGLGQGDDGSTEPIETAEAGDECEGEYAHLLIECKGQSDPKGSRASLTGLAGLNGKTSGGLGNLFDGADTGEPGGEGKDSDGSGGGSGAFGAGIAGGVGAGGAGAGSTGAGGAGSEEGLDTDIHKGFMGAGSFGGSGGGGSGGGYRGGASRVGGIGGLSNGGLNKAALQRKLKKAASDSSRKPASQGGANGPFEDNWAVVKKAYKKNSSTLHHEP